MNMAKISKRAKNSFQISKIQNGISVIPTSQNQCMKKG